MDQDIIIVDCWSDDGNYYTFMNLVSNAKPNSHIILAAGEEYDIHDCPRNFSPRQKQWEYKQQVKAYCQENNIRVDIITSAIIDSVNQVNSSNGPIYLSDIFNIISVPSFWSLRSLTPTYYGHGGLPFVNHEYTHFNKLFVNLNGKAAEHRCEIMDGLAKYDLINNRSVVTWCRMEDVTGDPTDYQFKHWVPELLMFERPEDLYNTHTANATAPTGYEECLFDFVSETTIDFQFWTEKTYRPMLCKKPFLIIGHPNANLGLKQFGFEVFDEVFDYSFDTKKSFSDRVEGAVEQLCRYKDLSDSDLMDMYRLLKPKIDHNFEQLMSMPRNYPLPEIVYKAYPNLLRDQEQARRYYLEDK